jgi:hypothetical protein
MSQADQAATGPRFPAHCTYDIDTIAILRVYSFMTRPLLTRPLSNAAIVDGLDSQSDVIGARFCVYHGAYDPARREYDSS